MNANIKNEWKYAKMSKETEKLERNSNQNLYEIFNRISITHQWLFCRVCTW